MHVYQFMKPFWKEQKDFPKKRSGARYQPLVNKFHLSIASKSASAYNESRLSNVLTLRSLRNSRDNKNVICLITVKHLSI